MKRITFVALMFFVASFHVALCDSRGSYVPAMDQAPQSSPRASATRVAIAPVALALVTGQGRWGGNIPVFVEERIYCVAPEVGRRFGVEIVERAGLQAIAAEQDLRDNPMFDPSTFPDEGQGQGASAQILATVTRCTLAEHNTNFSIGGGRSRVTINQTRIEATVWVQARVVGVGLIKISGTAEGRASASVVLRDRSGVGRFQPSRYGFGDWAGRCQNGAEASALTEAADKAIIGMLTRLLPAVQSTAAMRDGWHFDPATGQPIGPIHCPKCGKEMPSGANFCPFDGVSLRFER